MSFKRSNKMTVSQQKNVSDLFALIEQSNNATLQELVDHRNLVRTFSTGMDGQSEEQSQFNGGNSEAAINNSQAEYDKEHERWRTVGTNGDDFNKNRAAVLRESRK